MEEISLHLNFYENKDEKGDQGENLAKEGKSNIEKEKEQDSNQISPYNYHLFMLKKKLLTDIFRDQVKMKIPDEIFTSC